MKVYQISNNSEIENNDIDTNDLMSYLCEIVSSETDEEIKKAKIILNNSTQSVKHINNNFRQLKKSLDIITSELAKEKQMKRVLNRIETLNKEGSLRGQKKTSILKILPQLNNYDFSKLSKLEEKLSIF